MSTKKDSKKQMTGGIQGAIVFAKIDGKWLGMDATDEVFAQMLAYAQTISEGGRLLMHSLAPEFAECLEQTKKEMDGEKRGLMTIQQPGNLQ